MLNTLLESTHMTSDTIPYIQTENIPYTLKALKTLM